MPPQPLSKVRPKAIVGLGPRALHARPQLAALVAEIIGFWSEVDVQRGHLLSTLLGAGDGPALAMYLALTSTAARRAALLAVVHSVLNQVDEDLFAAISKYAVPIEDERNHFAHGLWGYSDDVPDGLLLVNSAYRLQDMLK